MILQRLKVITPVSLIIIVTSFPWLMTNIHSGMPYETSLINYSIQKSFISGFLFTDSLRPFTSASYHLGTQLSLLLTGRQGSFVWIQLFFLILLIARSLILYKLLLTLGIFSKKISLTAALLLGVYSVDGSTYWVGQMNQIWATDIALTTLLLLAVYGRNQRKIVRIILLISIFAFEYVAIWSYETIILPVLLIGIVIIKQNQFIKQKFTFSLLFALNPIIYSIWFANITLNSQDQYRASLISKDGNVLEYFKNLIWEIFESYNLSRWIDNIQNINLISIICVLIIVLLLFFYNQIVDRTVENLKPFTPNLFWTCILLLFVQILLLIPFAPTTSARSLWRTHLISAVPVSLLIAIVFLQIQSNKRRILNSNLLIAILIGVLTLLGLSRGYFHKDIWQKQNNVIAQVTKILDCGIPKNGMILILPSDNSTGGENYGPFGHNMWLEEALKLQYGVKDNPDSFYISTSGILAPGAESIYNLVNPVFIIMSSKKLEIIRDYDGIPILVREKIGKLEIGQYECGNSRGQPRKWYSN